MKNYPYATILRGSRPRVSPTSSQPPNGRFSFIAIEEEVQTPSRHDFAGDRRLKIVRIEQEAISSAPSAPRREQRAFRPSPAPSRRELLQPPATRREFESQLDDKSVRLRAVDKIMRDDAGHFYEMRGQQARRLGELVMDEAGKVFELCAAGETKPHVPAQEKTNGKAVHVARDEHSNGKSKLAEAPQPPRANGQADATAQPVEKTASPKLPAYQKLFADPGIRLQLEFSRIKREIASQLQHPEKLQDGDHIECYAQFYEAHHALPVARIAAAELGNAALQSQFHFLTKGKAQILGTPQLFKPTPHSFETEIATRQLHPGQCVYRLRPIFDPTIAPAPKPIAPVVEPQKELRRQIPAPYLNPLQFKYSREEVLYDMKGTWGTLPLECSGLKRWLFIYPLRLLKTLLVVITGRSQMKKWRAMLAGKNFDEQLWAVTPPDGFAYHPAVRQWTEVMLSRAGYDAERMLMEWEIFWRREARN